MKFSGARFLAKIGLLCALGVSRVAGATVEVPLSLESFRDDSRALTIEDILAQEKSLRWQPTRTENPRFGYSRGRIWFRFRIPESKLLYGSYDPLMLEIAYPYLERISFYSTLEGKVVRSSFSGLIVPVSERDTGVLRSGANVFRISAPRSPDAEYFLSIEGNYPLALPTALIEAPNFAYHHWINMLWVGIFLGILLSAGMFNGVLAFSLRSRMYRNYSFFVFAVILLGLAHEGLTIQLFWPEWPWWNMRETHLYAGVGLFFYVLFLRELLNSKRVAPTLDRALMCVLGMASVRAIWMLFSTYQPIFMWAEISVIVCNLLVLAIGVQAWRKGVRAARYFFFASVAFHLAVSLYIVQETNVLRISELLRWAPHLGVALEVVLLGMALGDRISFANKELAAQRAAVVQADKLGALGRMAGEIAHEINNPLAIIHGNAVLLRKWVQDGSQNLPDLAQMAGTIEQTSNRISKVVKGMKALARDSRSDPFQETLVSSIFQDALALSQEPARRRGIRLEVVNPPPGLALRCRSSEICQVLVNLLNNAMDAVEGLSDPWVRLEASRGPGVVEIAVVDSGGGVPKGIRQKIQEPFFTTKEAGKGLGLGLSISRTIAEGHGGSLKLDEESYRTRFVFTIPVEKS